MTTPIRAAHAEELVGLAQFIARLQRRPESSIAYLGDTPDDVAAEIEGWGPAWSNQSLVATRNDEVVGFIGADIDPGLGRVWLNGPFAEPADWDSLANVLLERILVDVVGGDARDLELAGDVANERLGDLARRHGFRRGTPSYALEIGREAISRLPSTAVPALEAGHHVEFVALHDMLFPATYYSGPQLVDQQARGEAIVLGLVENGRLTGYAAGRVDTASDGYLDFVGVAADARGEGRGRRLVTSLCQTLLERGARSKVGLTVYEDNAAALTLYDRLGFVRTASLVGYRRRTGEAESAP